MRMLPILNTQNEDSSDLQRSEDGVSSEADMQLFMQLFQQSMSSMPNFQPENDAMTLEMERAIAAQNQKHADFNAHLSSLEDVRVGVQAQIDERDRLSEEKKNRAAESRLRRREEMELLNQRISNLENLVQELKK